MDQRDWLKIEALYKAADHLPYCCPADIPQGREEVVSYVRDLCRAKQFNYQEATFHCAVVYLDAAFYHKISVLRESVNLQDCKVYLDRESRLTFGC